MKRTLSRYARLGAALALGFSVSTATLADDDETRAPPPPQELSAQTLYRFLLAEIAGARGQSDLAAQLYLDLARTTRDPRIARRATEIALYSRNTEIAAEAASLWTETDPESEAARRVLAGVGAGGSMENVQIQLARALALAPAALPQKLLGLNRALARMQDKQAAQTMIMRLTEPYLELPEAHFARAQAAAIAEDMMEALAAIEGALQIQPDWEPGILFKSQLLVQAGASAEALKLIEDRLATHPDSRELRLAHARVLVSDKQFERARVEFRRLLDSAPDDRDLLYAVALLSLQAEDNAEAERLLQRALEAGHPEADVIRLHLGQLADKRGDHDAARTWYEAVTSDPHVFEARLRAARSLLQQGRLDDARRHLQPPAGAPDAERYLMAETQLLREAGQTEAAFDLIDNALRQHPDSKDLLYESAMLAERLNRVEVMEGRLRKLIALDPEHAHAHNALGYSLADRGLRLDEAETLIARALELAPEDPFIIDSMGWVRFRQGDKIGALGHLERAYKLRADPEIAAHLGEVLWSLERRDDANRLLDAALAAHPDNTMLRDTAARLRKP